jgi:microcystin-dependent protein
MSDPFVAEIRIFAGNFPPTGWAFCNGQILPISQNTALFSLLGTNYGGDGKSTFALPDLRQRMPLHAGYSQWPGLSPYGVGQMGGEAAVALSRSEMPQHGHASMASSALASVGSANGGVLAKTVSPNPPYHDPSTLQPLGPNALGMTGGGQPHNNQQPFLELNFIIALQGIFPPRS